MFVSYSASEIGPRLTNQDSWLVEQINGAFVLAVADGVGGGLGGEIASKRAIESIKNLKNFEYLEKNIQIAHEKILVEGQGNKNLFGMATTLTAICMSENILKGIHCGDSRIYLLRGKGLKQLSVDHTEVAQLLAQGVLSKEEALNYRRKNILVSALGVSNKLVLQTFSHDIKSGDRVLLMTDGVYSHINKKEIVFLSKNCSDFKVFCKKIMALVGDRGPTDNFTLVGCEVL